MTKRIKTFSCLILSLSTPILFLSCLKSDGLNTSTVTFVPFAPTDLTATLVSTTKVNLNWIDKSTNEIGFKQQILQ